MRPELSTDARSFPEAPSPQGEKSGPKDRAVLDLRRLWKLNNSAAMPRRGSVPFGTARLHAGPAGSQRALAGKGLEWPVVIPINITGSPKCESGLVQDRLEPLFSIPRQEGNRRLRRRDRLEEGEGRHNKTCA
jgi:hypothetical protein